MQRMRCACLSLLLVTSLAAAAGAVPARETGFLFKSLRQAGRDYKYAVFVPRNYTPAQKWPLIVFLHGAGECGNDGAKHIAQGIGTAILWDVEKWPFIVLFPQKPEVRDAWEQHDDAIMEMLKRARKDYNVDETRLYLTGLSQGGHGTWALGAKHADIWAAIAPICGYARPAKPEDLGKALRDMPLWCFHGDADTAVPLQESRDLTDAVKAAGGSPLLTIYPGVGHNSWDKAYREEKLYEWLLAHRRTDK